ncbi:MAG TPA: TolC family protein [Polyangiaceae bacterium]|jgi:outer membrane protein TolC|nr:TolC family protein [Polyangiaceae bacterium]
MALRVRLCAGALALIFYWVALSDVALADSPNAASAREAKAARTSDSLARNGVLDRDAFVRVVLKQNQSLEAARQSARAAAAHVRATGALPDPMIDASLAPLSVGSSNARLGYEFGIRQEVPWFGKLGLERDVAAAEAGAARSDYESTRRDLALAAATLYSQYYVATRSLEINAHHVELMRAMRDSVTASLEAGRGSLRDSLYIQAELAHMEHDAVVLASERDVLIAQMNELLHRAPAAALPAAPAKLERAPAPELNEAQLEREARENRPEISAAKQHARA